MSPIEQRLWHAVRGAQLGASFRRQHPIGPYVLDFYCASRSLAIELDGDDHANRAARDVIRTRYLNRRGIRVVRFTNHEVWGNLDGVLEMIAIELQHPQRSTPTRRAKRTDLPLSGGGMEKT